ncbi:putative integral membrane protein [Cryptosporidium felis]|nr:putative integral membrane protein [Cryptosporidium felis]
MRQFKAVVVLLVSLLAFTRQVALGATPNFPNASEVYSIWDPVVILTEGSGTAPKTIANILNDLAVESQGKLRDINPKKTSKKELGRSFDGEPPLERGLAESGDIITETRKSEIKKGEDSKSSHERSEPVIYLPESLEISSLKRPRHISLREVASLLLREDHLEQNMDGLIYYKYDFHGNLVSIRNTTLEMPALGLLQSLIFDVDSTCRLSLEWFKSYPGFVEILERSRSEEYSDSEVSMESKLSRKFSKSWLKIFVGLRTLRVDSETYSRSRRALKKAGGSRNEGSVSYTSDIQNELYLFNSALLEIFSKLNYYIPFIVYFPNTGRLFNSQEENGSDAKERAPKSDRIPKTVDPSRLKKVDIYVNRIPKKVLKEIRTSISSCYEAQKLLLEFGISTKNTPVEIISLFLQLRRITRILLNIYKSEVKRLGGFRSTTRNPGNPLGENLEYSKQQHIFASEQKLVPNSVGFKLLQQTSGDINRGNISEKKSQKTSQVAKAHSRPQSLQFNYLSKETVNKFYSQSERNLHQLLYSDLSLRLDKGFGIVEKRPSGAPGLIIYSQKYPEETSFDCIIHINDGNFNFIFQNEYVESFKDKIQSWFKSNYLNQNSKPKNNSKIPLQFKLAVACPYVTPSHKYMQKTCGAMGDVFLMVYLVGKIKGSHDWKLVAEFSELTNDTSLEWKIISMLIPGIDSELGNMCLVQTASLQSELLKSSRRVVIRSHIDFEDAAEELRYESGQINKSIIRNCLNYVDEGTMIEFLTQSNGDEDTRIAVCRQNKLYFG